MLILLIVIFVILFILDAIFSDGDMFFSFVYILGILACIGGIIWNTIKIADGLIIDEKIAMYQEENEKIENDIDRLVTQYMEYESETLGDLKGDSSITLVSLYPELKADELVKAQIETYQANNTKIKMLKADKLEISVAKWWIYFGK